MRTDDGLLVRGRHRISWTDETWNPLRGCSRTIAEGATTSGCGDPTGGGCYAERNGYRFAGPGLAYEGLVRMTKNGPRWTGKVLLVDEHLLDPIRWKRPRKIFTTSVSDPFHERLSNETIAIVYGVMVATPRHTHQVLTKRVSRAREWYAWLERQAAAANGGSGMSPAAFCFSLLQRYVSDRARFTDADRRMVARSEIIDDAFLAPWPLPNLWLMTSIEHQQAAHVRIPDLLATPAVVRGLSCEPLIGRVDLVAAVGRLAGTPPFPYDIDLPDWIIAGCESGPGSRPCDVDWLRLLRDQCARSMRAFFLKQARLGVGITEGPLSKHKGGDLIETPYLDNAIHTAFPRRS
jgi:protein gp37